MRRSSASLQRLQAPLRRRRAQGTGTRILLARKFNPHQIDQQALAQVKALKSESGATSYLDLIPAKYRDEVINMANNTFLERIDRETTVGEYRERMAQGWLQNREAFKLLVKASGFDLIEEGDTFPTHKNGAIVALTASGSIVALSMPHRQMREVFYKNIGARKDTDIPQRGNGPLNGNIGIGKSIQTRFRTSLVIAAATNGPGLVADLQYVVQYMTLT